MYGCPIKMCAGTDENLPQKGQANRPKWGVACTGQGLVAGGW